jgi:hypothetical protein
LKKPVAGKSSPRSLYGWLKPKLKISQVKIFSLRLVGREEKLQYIAMLMLRTYGRFFRSAQMAVNRIGMTSPFVKQLRRKNKLDCHYEQQSHEEFPPF